MFSQYFISVYPYGQMPNTPRPMDTTYAAMPRKTEQPWQHQHPQTMNYPPRHPINKPIYRQQYSYQRPAFDEKMVIFIINMNIYEI